MHTITIITIITWNGKASAVALFFKKKCCFCTRSSVLDRGILQERQNMFSARTNSNCHHNKSILGLTTCSMVLYDIPRSDRKLDIILHFCNNVCVYILSVYCRETRSKLALEKDFVNNFGERGAQRCIHLATCAYRGETHTQDIICAMRVSFALL